MKRFEELYYEAKADKWFIRFAVFCRIILAISFIPSGFIKIMGERFTGLPLNNPLGHYFDALRHTGFYYNFIGIAQIITAILLLVRRTAHLGALMYFPIILNICVLVYATRFDGTRGGTMMVLASLFLLVWEYDRLKHILPIRKPKIDPPHVVKKPLGIRLRIIFFGGSFAVIAFIIIGTFWLFEIVPGNSEEECKNQCATSKNPAACEIFCDCIYKQGQPLDSCLGNFNKTKDIRGNDGK